MAASHNEAVNAQWAQIDFKTAVWHIPAEQMKKAGGKRQAHDVPLSSQAIALLEQLRPITGRSKFIFPHYSKANVPMSKETIANALRKMGYKGEMNTHGMRTVARTYLAEKDINNDHAETCLAHATGTEVSRAYNRTDYLEQRKPIMQIWGDFLEQCAKEKGVPFP